ncbi:hypothetical protein EZJ19_09645 [Parasulfuritortus cantonensis]|uniref:Tryptophan synthase subunit beta like protein n=1 Tax=Parasulfuritortus cantonensis TaxID=2528202 RepID=A0A4V2NVL1_9PROT|nr:hypothetical protein [Parasulfuritortus cantonensis]TCJ13912.1 hypothetical protein EZJ19_09645 [Parasulfuritortus cantonensis]
MPYVERDEAGKIVAMAAQESGSVREWLAEDSPELEAWLRGMASGAAGDANAVRALGESDLAVIRVVEDLIDLLIDKNVLCFTDLPAAAQEKLLNRRSLRRALHPLVVMKDDDGVI